MAPVDAHNLAIPGAIAPKIGEDLSEVWLNGHANFTPISKAPAEKSVTLHHESKNWDTVNLVYYVWRDKKSLL